MNSKAYDKKIRKLEKERAGLESSCKEAKTKIVLLVLTIVALFVVGSCLSDAGIIHDQYIIAADAVIAVGAAICVYYIYIAAKAHSKMNKRIYKIDCDLEEFTK